MTRFTNARGDIEDYTYNTNGWLWKVKNGRNVERVYTYNSRGEVTKLEHPGQSDEKWSYLPTGQLDIYDNSLFTVDHNYDDAGRLTLVDYPAGTTDTSFTYDNADRPKTMVRGSETTEWFYNAASELTKFESPEGKIEYEYRVDGLRSKMIRQTTHVTEYSYDDAGRLTSLKNPLNEITSFLYDRNSRLSRKTLHNGTDVVYGYDNRSRPTSINMEEDGEAIIWQSLGYDAASNITSHTINLVTTNYTYDDINQLLSEARTGHNTSYTYDGNGNRTQRVINGVTETYSYDNGDKLTSVTWTGGSKTYGYDNAGRLTSVTTGGVTTNLGYDHDNRVTSISRSGMTTNTFVYNGFGTRTSKTDSTGTRNYLRDGVGVTSPVLSDGAATYTPGISERRGTTSTYQLNGLKCTFAQSDANGGHVSSRNYDAFGAVTSSSGTHQGPFGYGGPYGYQTDPDTGLMLLGHRFYDPSVGRFLTRDPIKDGRNWYGYGGGWANPVNSVDPTGNEPEGFPPGYFLRIDTNQQPLPNAHLTTPSGSVIMIDPDGSIPPTHGGKPNPQLTERDRKALKGNEAMKEGMAKLRRLAMGRRGTPSIDKRLIALGFRLGKKGLKVLAIATLIKEGPVAAAKEVTFQEELEAGVDWVHDRLDDAQNEASSVMTRRMQRWGLDSSEIPW